MLSCAGDTQNFVAGHMHDVIPIYDDAGEVIEKQKHRSRWRAKGLPSKVNRKLAESLNKLTRVQSTSVGIAELISVRQYFATEWRTHSRSRRARWSCNQQTNFFLICFAITVQAKSAALVWSEHSTALSLQPAAMVDLRKYELAYDANLIYRTATNRSRITNPPARAAAC